MARLPKNIPDTPPPEGRVPSSYDTVKGMRRDIDAANQGVKDVQDTNRLLIVVMFIGYLGILVAVIIFAVTTIIADTSSRDDLKVQVQDLSRQVQELNSKIK